MAGMPANKHKTDVASQLGTEPDLKGTLISVLALGGFIVFIGIILMLYIFCYMVFTAPKEKQEFPLAEVAEDAEPTPMFLENWKLWIGITITLIVFAYTIPFMDIIQHSPPGSPGYEALIR
ncbi:hypothetical protein [Sediminibacillus massiliensis]|uniref:hypothetical protein n=1 Tax=Sediminibacillus massiliensis TaxID=1926277 RepID=UPI003CCB7DE1